jgi:hypothetical protein
MKSKHLIILVISASVLASCASYVKPVDEDVCTKCVGLIQDRKTTKTEVLKEEDFYTHLKTYKSGNNTILIFHFWNHKGWWDSLPREYNLVLIFDENDILIKHSLVRIQ